MLKFRIIHNLLVFNIVNLMFQLQVKEQICPSNLLFETLRCVWFPMIINSKIQKQNLPSFT